MSHDLVSRYCPREGRSKCAGAKENPWQVFPDGHIIFRAALIARLIRHYWEYKIMQMDVLTTNGMVFMRMYRKEMKVEMALNMDS